MPNRYINSRNNITQQQSKIKLLEGNLNSETTKHYHQKFKIVQNRVAVNIKYVVSKNNIIT